MASFALTTALLLRTSLIISSTLVEGLNRVHSAGLAREVQVVFQVAKIMRSSCRSQELSSGAENIPSHVIIQQITQRGPLREYVQAGIC